MSQFLAPIHSWLFKKICILEQVEKRIEEVYGNTSVSQAVKEAFGDYLPEAPLEELIDVNNIHGWLQQRINVAERRQASLVHHFMKEDDKAIDKIVACYYEEGVFLGKAYQEAEMMDSLNAMEIYTELNNILLEGMPCDRVNSLVENDEKQVVWKTVHCVHQQNWEENGVDVRNYYDFREALTKGFVEAIAKSYQYTYQNQEHQIHTIALVS
ncbi:MAG: hypothetical protein JW708_01620 [Vallitaleaceae bacterium]|nr:hypothetical protein [Vallitaleaceae bacterium]